MVEMLPAFRGYGYAIDPREYRIRREEMRVVLVLPKSASCPLGCVLVEFQK